MGDLEEVGSLFLPYGPGAQTQVIRCGGSTFTPWTTSSIVFACLCIGGHMICGSKWGFWPESRETTARPYSFCKFLSHMDIGMCPEGLLRNQRLICETLRTRNCNRCSVKRPLQRSPGSRLRRLGLDLSSTRPLLPRDMLALTRLLIHTAMITRRLTSQSCS